MGRKEKIISELKSAGIDLAILTSPPNVTYASGFEVPYWPAFMGDMSDGLPMVITCIGTESNEIWMAASEFYKSKIERAGRQSVLYFRSFTHEAENNVFENFSRTLMETVGKCVSGTTHLTVGIEKERCPVCVLDNLKEAFNNITFIDVSECMSRVRLIKTDDEIMKLKQAAGAADAAQMKLYEIAQEEGEYTELDIWFEVQKAVCRQTGALTPFVGELVTGPRTGLSDYPLGPSERKVKRGDIAIMDISPRVEGYWADCSNVVVFWDKPDEEQLRYFEAVKDIYESGRDAIKPGVTCREVNEKMERVYKKHGFEICSYQGHQIGVSVNEIPRFTYCDETVLKENMVVCIEPQIYTGARGKTGVRLERMLHITQNGACELNKFRWGLD